MEIDGASNRGIEHIRELREAVKYAPVSGKYKVYVIDEVHMLTNEAFNALLKTLEEPPPHVIFIFATTEPQKIPATIHSRCQRYGFKRILLSEITSRLRHIADAEEIQITDQGLTAIARAAEGSMRDSQSLLDQAVSYSGKKIEDEDLQIILGTVPQAFLLKFMGALLVRDAAELLKQIDTLLEQGQDMRQFLGGVIEHLRNLLVVKVAKDPGRIIELPSADIEALKQQAADPKTEHLLLLFDSLSKTLDEMRWSAYQRFTFEVGIVKACAITSMKPIAEVLSQVQELETRLASGHAVAGQASIASEQVSQYQLQHAKKTEPSSQTISKVGTENLWGSIHAAIKTKKPSLASFLEHACLIEASEGKLVIGVYGGFQIGQLEKPENKKHLEETASDILKQKIQITIRPLQEPPVADGKIKKTQKAAHKEPDPSLNNVLEVFTQGTVIESDQ